MDRTNRQTHDLIDLGVATTETRGNCVGIIEFIGLMLTLGLSRD